MSRKKWLAGILAAALCTTSLAPVVSAESLWNNPNGYPTKSLFADHRATGVGDIVTIVINETTTTSATRSSAAQLNSVRASAFLTSCRQHRQAARTSSVPKAPPPPRIVSQAMSPLRSWTSHRRAILSLRGHSRSGRTKTSTRLSSAAPAVPRISPVRIRFSPRVLRTRLCALTARAP